MVNYGAKPTEVVLSLLKKAEIINNPLPSDRREGSSPSVPN
jgi:ribosomal protein S16